MKNRKLLAALYISFIYIATSSAQQAPKFANDRIIAKFKSGVPATNSNAKSIGTGINSLDALNAKYNCYSVEKLLPDIQETDAAARNLKLFNIAILRFSTLQNIPELVKQYTATGLFEYVEPDYTGTCGGQEGIELSANDTYFASRQWSMQNNGTFTPGPSKAGADINIVNAWNITTGSPNIVIGIIDTGTKLDHPEFSGRIWTNTKETAGNGVDDDGNGYIDDTAGGWDFTNNDNTATDDNGHGTNVTGIIGANGNNGSLYAGVNWQSKLMIVKALDASGSGSYSNWIKGINYCVNNGAHVINMSLSGTNSSQALDDGVTYAYNKNVVCIVAMGNNNNGTPLYPAACTHAFAVGATNSSDQRCNPYSGGSGGSNYGPNIKVVAPGNYIYGLRYNSNTSGSYYYSGTSQAAPHVTGLASLLLSQNPDLTSEQLMGIIKSTADDQVGLASEDVAGWDQYYGFGRINAYKALTYITTGINSVEPAPPLKIYPNPFTSDVNVSYHLSQPGNVKIEISDILGQRVQLINNGAQQAGSFTENWNGKNSDGANLPAGIYIVSLTTNDSERTSFRMVKQ